jgi:UDP-N-acetylmuramoylalanine--D-glutamate ligase
MAEKILILGAGESGTGAARLAKRLGYGVFVSDAGSISDANRSLLLEDEIDFEEGSHSPGILENAHRIIKSPGIPPWIPFLVEAREKGIEIIDEVEFAAEHSKASILAITGSNGKTTTTALLGHILKSAEYDVEVGGNIGRSFASILLERDPEFAVLELSSFQLEGVKNFRPRISILTNITPDHLDRYEQKMELYAQAKMNICKNQQADDLMIWCAEDPYSREFIPQDHLFRKAAFGLEKSPELVSWTENNQLYIQSELSDKNRFEMSIYDLALQGKHNIYNSMAAAIAARAVDVSDDIIRQALTDFETMEHRLEKVGQVHGIEFINDSKATNVNSTWYALESIEKPLVWIVGGVDKGNDYSSLIELVRHRVKAIVCLGIDNRKIHEAFSHHVDLVVNTGSMMEAVKMSYHLADSGDCVLLSPACASFDLFENYEDRGRQFKYFVREL